MLLDVVDINRFLVFRDILSALRDQYLRSLKQEKMNLAVGNTPWPAYASEYDYQLESLLGSNLKNFIRKRFGGRKISLVELFGYGAVKRDLENMEYVLIASAISNYYNLPVDGDIQYNETLISGNFYTKSLRHQIFMASSKRGFNHLDLVICIPKGPFYYKFKDVFDRYPGLEKEVYICISILYYEILIEHTRLLSRLGVIILQIPDVFLENNLFGPNWNTLLKAELNKLGFDITYSSDFNFALIQRVQSG